MKAREQQIDERVEQLEKYHEACENLCEDIKSRARSTMGLAALKELHAKLVTIKREHSR